MSWIITGTQRYQPAALLDQFPGAAAAYSLRNLVGTSNPSVVRVRRDSDDAEQDFTAAEVSDGTLAAWVGAGNDGFVSILYDQSGNNNHATQSTEASQMTVVQNGSVVLVNGMPCAKDGEVVASFSVDIATLYSVVAANLDPGFGVNTVLLSLGGSVDNRRWYAPFFTSGDANVYRFFHGSAPVGAGNISTPNAITLYSMNADGVNVKGYVNSDEVSSAGLQGSGVPSSDQFFVAPISGAYEWLVYSSDQSTNRAAIEANINAHYNIF